MDTQDEQDKKIKHEEELLNLDKQHISGIQSVAVLCTNQSVNGH